MSLKVLIDDQIEKLFEDSPELKEINKNKFEIAVANFTNLKFLNGLEIEDLVDGIMGDGGDEGIDLCYLFNNGQLIRTEDTPLNKDSSVKAKFFQIKKEEGFSTDGFRKLKEGIEQIFDFDKDEEALRKIGANEDYIEKANIIRKVFRENRKTKGKFLCEVYYITLASEPISEKIKAFEKELKENKLLIPFECHFLGAQELLDLTSSSNEIVEIRFDSQPLNISEKASETTGYAGFVNGNQLLSSLIDEEQHFKSHLTEGNIRFFLGQDKDVNSSIIKSAKDSSKAMNFWAMNNGITIIGDSITPLDSKEYSIENPQIVNGCQTVHCLYEAYLENSNKLPESLKVFVKLVKTENVDIQTDIISATNSQNPVKASSLKANDDIQKNIEKYIKDAGIFYERRDNYYKKQGYTGNKVIGLQKMAQIIHTVVNKESIIASNDVAKLFSSETKYNSIFNNKADYDVYKFSVLLYQKIWTMKNSDMRVNDYSPEIKDLILASCKTN